MRAGSRENVSCVSCAEPVRRGQTLTSLDPRWTVTLWPCKGDGERKRGKETKVTDFRWHFHADRKADIGTIGLHVILESVRQSF